jgi:hypothetical protein
LRESPLITEIPSLLLEIPFSYRTISASIYEQNDVKQPLLLVSLWAFSWLFGAAAPSFPKHVLCASLSFYPNWAAFLLFVCHLSPCQKRSLLAALQVCVLMFRSHHSLAVAFSCQMPSGLPALAMHACRVLDPA